jgi:hypothetical protein
MNTILTIVCDFIFIYFISIEKCQCVFNTFIICYSMLLYKQGYVVVHLFEALCYKPEGSVFES